MELRLPRLDSPNQEKPGRFSRERKAASSSQKTSLGEDSVRCGRPVTVAAKQNVVKMKSLI